MNSSRPLVIAVGLILGGQLAFAQDMSRYGAYVLESSLDSVVAASVALSRVGHGGFGVSARASLVGHAR